MSTQILFSLTSKNVIKRDILTKIVTSFIRENVPVDNEVSRFIINIKLYQTLFLI